VSQTPLFDLESSDADRRRVEEALLEAVQTPDAYLTEIASHLLLAGGKRLRPMFSVVASQVAGAPTTEDAVQGGISCELVHLGSLYHDDVMDESPTRRGVETVNAKWGNLQAILAGDFLLARASEIAASLGTEVAALLARTIGRLCEGQIEELRHTYNVARPVESYLSSISGKTASLYATAARIGDLLDLSATDAQLGKPSGHDMVEGVYTLPVLHTLASGGVPARELADVLGKPLDMAERDKALSIVRSNGGIEAAIEVAEMYVEAAEEACRALPNSAATVALRFAPNHLLSTVR
jgi:heptaprenyl diphosphate synthase